MDDFNQQLSLVVLNSEQLDGSQQVQYRFDEMGGTLGASEQDDWQLRDRLGAVMPAHARIELNDGRFCLCDLSGQTYINGATSPIGRARKVHLEQGDELVVGPFRLRAYLGAYIAQLGGVDVISFTAGVGENSPLVRAAALETLGFLGVRVDPTRNEERRRGIRVISTDDSAVTVLVVPTNEELEIARQTLTVTSAR